MTRKKVSVTTYLTHEQLDALQARRAKTGVPIAVMFREAIDDYLKEMATLRMRVTYENGTRVQTPSETCIAGPMTPRRLPLCECGWALTEHERDGCTARKCAG